MNKNLEVLLGQIKDIELEVQNEIEKKEKLFGYQIKKGKAHFTAKVRAQHKLLATTLYKYLRHSKLFSVLTAPVIWFCVIPVLLMHLVAKVYQSICFPIYGIPKVNPKD